MENCSYCGAPLEAGRAFCSRCGKTIQAAGTQTQAINYNTGANNQQYYNQFNQQNYNQENYNQFNQQNYNQQFGAGNQAQSGNQQYYGAQPQYSDSYNGANYSGAAAGTATAGTKKKPSAFASGRERREARFNTDFLANELLSDRAYYGWLGGTVLYALIVNLITCVLSGNYMHHILYETDGSFLIWLYVGYFVGAIAGLIVVNKSSSVIGSFIGYNLIVLPLGFVISVSVVIFGGVSSGIVTSAFVMTLVITMIMVTASLLKPALFEKLGSVLLIGILALLAVSAVSLLTGKEYMIWTYIGAGLFSLYIGFDMYRASCYPKTKTNAINCAIDLYLDIINLFLRLLRIMAKYGGKRR